MTNKELLSEKRGSHQKNTRLIYIPRYIRGGYFYHGRRRAESSGLGRPLPATSDHLSIVSRLQGPPPGALEALLRLRYHGREAAKALRRPVARFGRASQAPEAICIKSHQSCEGPEITGCNCVFSPILANRRLSNGIYLPAPTRVYRTQSPPSPIDALACSFSSRVLL
jgi:hypothetical protein